MKKYNPIIVTNGIVFVSLLLLSAFFDFLDLGFPGAIAAITLFMGVINLFGALLMAMLSKKESAKYLLLCGGVLFLIGFTLCSALLSGFKI